MEPIRFTKWGGPEGLEQHIIAQTGCKPYSGAGINPRIHKKISILKSVDNTYYYDDDLSDPNHPTYTLFGHNGDQREDEKQFNEPLLQKTDIVYLYRVTKKDHDTKKPTEYWWYGAYQIVGKHRKQHQGMDHSMRTIVVLSLARPTQ